MGFVLPENRVKLISAGTIIDAAIIDRLRDRGITDVIVEWPAKGLSNVAPPLEKVLHIFLRYGFAQDNASSPVSASMNIPVEQRESSSSPTRLYAATSSGSHQLIPTGKALIEF